MCFFKESPWCHPHPARQCLPGRLVPRTRRLERNGREIGNETVKEWKLPLFMDYEGVVTRSQRVEKLLNCDLVNTFHHERVFVMGRLRQRS